MTITDEILICANQLANAGKKPTVALIKAKLSQRPPLAVLITTLKNWQHQPDFIMSIDKDSEKVSENSPESENSALLDSLLESGTVKKMIEQSLALELTEMRNELSEMKLLIKNLTEQLNQKN